MIMRPLWSRAFLIKVLSMPEKTSLHEGLREQRLLVGRAPSPPSDPLVRQIKLLPDHEEAGLHFIARDAVPHHAGLADRYGVLEIDHLSSVQRNIGVDGAESAGAVIHQLSGDLLRRRILEGELERASAGVASFGAAIGG